MKLKSFLAILAVAVSATGFTSCDDDDDDNAFVHPAAGQYFGVNSMKVMGVNQIDSTSVVELIGESESSISMRLPETAKNSKAPAMEVPPIVLKNLPIVSANGGFEIAIAKTDTLKAIGVKSDGSKMEVAVWDFKASIKGSEMDLNYTIKMGAMPMPLKDSFKGSKK